MSATGGAGTAAAAAGGEPTPDQLYDLAVPDASNTLGGLKDDVDPEHPSVLGHLVSSLMPGQDLTRVTIPAFFLEPRSLLERMADTLMHPDLLLAAVKEDDPVERMKGLVKWFLSGFHYKTTGVKKPYNPIIGETFACFWKHPDGSRSQYFAEQVLHRPPISAIYFENREHNLHATAHVWTKSQFAAPQTVKSILDGACVLTLGGRGGETYHMTFPTYYAHGLLMGTLRMEIGDTVHIVCEKTGLRADIDFLQKPTFGGADKQNAVDGYIRRMPAGAGAASKKTGGGGWFGGGASKPEGEELFHVTGHWDKLLFIAPAGSSATPTVLLDVEKAPVAPKYVLPVELQGPWESRRLWRFTTAELLTRPAVDWAQVDREKGQLEEEQRLIPCHAAKEGAAGYEDWATKKFHKKPVRDPLADKEAPLFTFDDMPPIGTPFKAGDAPFNALALSRSLPDIRGGKGGAGAVEPHPTNLKTIKISAKRQAEGWEKF